MGRQAAGVDRERTCPFLVKVYVRDGAYLDPVTEVGVDKPLRVQGEADVYTWKDASLRELMLNVVDSNPSLKAGYARFSFRLFYLDPTPRPGPPSDAPARYNFRDLGTVFARDLTLDSAALNPKTSSLRTLEDHRFVIGDVLSVAALSGNNNAPLPPAASPAPGPLTASALGRPMPPSRSAPVGLDSLRPTFSVRGRGSAAGVARRPSDRASWANGGGSADRRARDDDGLPRGKRESDAAGWRRRKDSRSRSPPPRAAAAEPQDRNGMEGW